MPEHFERAGFYREENSADVNAPSEARTFISTAIEGGESLLDEDARLLLTQIVSEYPYLSQVGIEMVAPEDEPNTAGYFRRVQVDDNTFIPTISVVIQNSDHLEKLAKARKFSVEYVERLLNLEPGQLTPRLLRLFIIAHEMGHAKDYIRNYATSSEYTSAEAAEAWDLHYDMNLSSLPLESIDPAQLQALLAGADNLEDFLATNPELRTGIFH